MELHTSVIKKHQELFSPPLPDVHVTTPDELVDQFDQPDALKGTPICTVREPLTPNKLTVTCASCFEKPN